MTMGRLEFGRLSEAWRGEASDFTPLLSQQLDNLGEAIGVSLATLGETEVRTAGGRRIDIVAQGDDGAEFVIENQYGKADHDHLTRGLAYAVASEARGLVVVAEEHRDEFRAVARYLNDMAELDPLRGVAIWLVEARAVRVGDSQWAPLFSPVVEPNTFTAAVEQAKLEDKVSSVADFVAGVPDPMIASLLKRLADAWAGPARRFWLDRRYITLTAKGPSASGFRSVLTAYPDGSVLVPLGAYAGANSGISIDALTTPAFVAETSQTFGFKGTEKLARTPPGWFTEATFGALLDFAGRVARAYEEAPVIVD